MFSYVHGRSILKRNFTDRDSKFHNSNQTHLFLVAHCSSLSMALGMHRISFTLTLFFSFSLGTIDNLQREKAFFHTLLWCFMIFVSISLVQISCSDAERFGVVSCDNYNCFSPFFVRFVIMLENRSDFYPYLDKLYSNCNWHFLLNMLVSDVYQHHKCFSDSYPFGYNRKQKLFACKWITIQALFHWHIFMISKRENKMHQQIKWKVQEQKKNWTGSEAYGKNCILFSKTKFFTFRNLCFYSVEHWEIQFNWFFQWNSISFMRFFNLVEDFLSDLLSEIKSILDVILVPTIFPFLR